MRRAAEGDRRALGGRQDALGFSSGKPALPRRGADGGNGRV
ncbi:hypothetical protein ACP70R_008096 [Stipagrostis hirtigluma subsp. patula]